MILSWHRTILQLEETFDGIYCIWLLLMKMLGVLRKLCQVSLAALSQDPVAEQQLCPWLTPHDCSHHIAQGPIRLLNFAPLSSEFLRGKHFFWILLTRSTALHLTWAKELFRPAFG